MDVLDKLSAWILPIIKKTFHWKLCMLQHNFICFPKMQTDWSLKRVFLVSPGKSHSLVVGRQAVWVGRPTGRRRIYCLHIINRYLWQVPVFNVHSILLTVNKLVIDILLWLRSTGRIEWVLLPQNCYLVIQNFMKPIFAVFEL